MNTSSGNINSGKTDSGSDSDRKQPEDSLKRYEKPRIVSRERLESVAAVCSGPNSKETGQFDSTGVTLCGANGGQIRS